MTVKSEFENKLICPNCQALNSPGSKVCTSCGINIDEFRAALPRLEHIKSSRTAAHREQLENEKQIKIHENFKKSEQSFRKLLLLFFISIFIVGIIVTIGVVFYANQVKRTQDEMAALYEKSLQCMHEENFLCARDGFSTLIISRANFPNLDGNLNISQYGLASQYYKSGQWERAVDELNELLIRDPGNQNAIEMLKTSYDRWIDQLGYEGNWFKRWLIRRERDARFPPKDS